MCIVKKGRQNCVLGKTLKWRSLVTAAAVLAEAVGFGSSSAIRHHRSGKEKRNKGTG